MDNIFLINKMRSVWEQHVWWTRMLIVGILVGLPDLNNIATRLLRNPKDMANVFRPFYGNEISSNIQKLIEEHLLIADELVNALKNNETAKFNDANRRWYINADNIASYFSMINPYYNRQELQRMLYEHLDLTKEEAATYFKKDYDASIRIFDNVESQALMMADFFVSGLLRQF